MAYDGLIEREKELYRIHDKYLTLQILCREGKDAKICYCSTFNKFIEVYDSRPMNERKPMKCDTCIEKMSHEFDEYNHAARLAKGWAEEWRD